MDDLSLVSVLHSEGHRANQLGGLFGRLRLPGEPPVKAAASDKFHGEVGSAGMGADLVDLHDIRMPHARRGLRLDLKAAPLLPAGQGAVPNQFQRDQPL